MSQTYSQELIEEIKEMVFNRMEELKAMDRATLSAEYLKVVGVEAHPRMHLDMMAKMIARFYQGELWNEKTGDIPPAIREKDMKFWLSMEAYFVPKAALKEEQAQPITAQIKKKKKTQLGPKDLPGSQGTGLQSKAKNLDESILVIQSFPGTEDNTEIVKAFRLIEANGHDGRMTYQDFEKECKKKKLASSPNMLALLLKRHGFIKLEYPAEEMPLPSPPQEEEEEKEEGENGMTFTEVLEGVEINKPTLIVEPECVDFGTGEKVSDYD
jgi:hypothetical protein